MNKFPFRLVLAAVALAGVLAATQLASTAAEGPSTAPPPFQPAVREKDGLLSASGLVEAVAENTLVGVPFAGLVAQVPAKVSARVKAGDPLLVLDTRELRPAAAAAQAAAERAEDRARRLRPLAGTGAVPEREITDAELAAREARAAADLAAAQLERATVRSPIDGTVLQVSVRPGEFVAAGGKAPVVVGDISRLQIRCDIDEQMAPRMREGLPAKGYLKGEVAKPGAPDRAIPLRFIRIEPFVVPKTSLTGASAERVDTRVLQVIYQFDRPADRTIFVGQQMDVYIDTAPDAK
jgi:RND family efflux transporter MFP subunit